MTGQLNMFLQDKNIVRLTMMLVAISILVPGVLKIGPPQWLHTPDMQSPASPKETVTAKKDTQLAANAPTPRELFVESLEKTKTPKASKPAPKVPPMAVARSFVRVIPASHVSLSNNEQKEKFINMVLPLILAANEEIIQRRAAIRRAFDRQDVVTLGKWAKLYKLPPENVVNQGFLDDLLARADVIPVPLALAQAAIESGWGTSRFARQGNALFGQWAWQEDVGIKPLNASNKNAVVRSFPNLLGSVRAYIHNLNTHQAYKGFRDSRKRLSKIPNEDKANMLVNHLHNYAEIGMKYVKDLKIVMRKNELRTYANAFLS